MAVIQPIPSFKSIVEEIVKDVGKAQRGGRVFSVDIGIICDTSTVRAVGGALFDRVGKELRGSQDVQMSDA